MMRKMNGDGAGQALLCLVDVEKNQIFLPPNAWELHVTLFLTRSTSLAFLFKGLDSHSPCSIRRK